FSSRRRHTRSLRDWSSDVCSSDLDAYLYDGLRSPIGRHAGKLAGLRPDDLAGEVIKEVVGRNKIDPADISDVVLGCVNQAGEDRSEERRVGKECRSWGWAED